MGNGDTKLSPRPVLECRPDHFPNERCRESPVKGLRKTLTSVVGWLRGLNGVTHGALQTAHGTEQGHNHAAVLTAIILL